jgi:hypothetical protein
LKISECADLLWSLYSGAALTFVFIVIGLMTIPYQAHAQTSPLTEDQDGDGVPLNEEDDLKWKCNFDHASGMTEAFEFAGKEMKTTLSEDDCNFAMHYLSGQCEEQATKGANVTQVCDATLKNYLSIKNLYTKDFPTDTERFNTILDQFKQKRTLEKQEAAQKEANKPV